MDLKEWIGFFDVCSILVVIVSAFYGLLGNNNSIVASDRERFIRWSLAIAGIAGLVQGVLALLKFHYGI